MTAPSNSIILEPTEQANAVVVWLHGLGADGNDFVPIVPELGLPSDHRIKFIFPNAPIRPITINGGMEMPGWYDIADSQLRKDIDIAGIKESAAAIEHIIDEEVQSGISSDRIILAGFSQGGAIAYYLGLRIKAKLAGIVALSTYIPAPESLENEGNGHNEVPIFIGHGSHDPLVAESLGASAENTLSTLGRTVTYRTYQMDHSVCLEEIKDIADFLRARLVY
jgi:phospholipase/carboxylesterase